MISYDQNRQVRNGRAYAFVPYLEGEMMPCGHHACAFYDDGCLYPGNDERACDTVSRKDRRIGYWKEVA